MSTVTSADQTTIAFDRMGSGPPLIDGRGRRSTRRIDDRPLAAALRDEFTVINPDRRGRGDSGDTGPYEVQREIEDIEALIEAAGGSAAVFGYSSGANLALRAACRRLLRSPSWRCTSHRSSSTAAARRCRRTSPRQLAELVSSGRRGDAVELYQTTAVGIPEPVVAQLRKHRSGRVWRRSPTRSSVTTRRSSET